MQLVLNDGTTIENGTAGYSKGFLWLYFSGYTMPQIAMLFCDPTKTARIVFQFGESENTYEGFTVCKSMNIDVDGNASVCMTKGVE